MRHLVFIRSITSWDPYQDQRTNVLVYGDVAGYEYFHSELLRTSRRSRRLVELSEIPRRSKSMRVVLVPAEPPVPSRPKMKIAEWLVYRTRRPEMELIFYANPAGFRRLAAIVRRLLNESIDDPWDHEHVDDWYDRWIVKRSVSLNIRGPVRRWTRRALAEHAETAFGGTSHYLSEDAEGMKPEDYPYEPPSPKTHPMLSLRDGDRP